MFSKPCVIEFLRDSKSIPSMVVSTSTGVSMKEKHFVYCYSENRIVFRTSPLFLS